MDLGVEQGDQDPGGEGQIIINVVRTSLVLLLKYFQNNLFALMRELR